MRIHGKHFPAHAEHSMNLMGGLEVAKNHDGPVLLLVTYPDTTNDFKKVYADGEFDPSKLEAAARSGLKAAAADRLGKEVAGPSMRRTITTEWVDGVISRNPSSLGPNTTVKVGPAGFNPKDITQVPGDLTVVRKGEGEVTAPKTAVLFAGPDRLDPSQGGTYGRIVTATSVRPDGSQGPVQHGVLKPTRGETSSTTIRKNIHAGQTGTRAGISSDIPGAWRALIAKQIRSAKEAIGTGLAKRNAKTPATSPAKPPSKISKKKTGAQAGKKSGGTRRKHPRKPARTRRVPRRRHRTHRNHQKKRIHRQTRR